MSSGRGRRVWLRIIGWFLISLAVALVLLDVLLIGTALTGPLQAARLLAFPLLFAVSCGQLGRILLARGRRETLVGHERSWLPLEEPRWRRGRVPWGPERGRTTGESFWVLPRSMFPAKRCSPVLSAGLGCRRRLADHHRGRGEQAWTARVSGPACAPPRLLPAGGTVVPALRHRAGRRLAAGRRTRGSNCRACMAQTDDPT
jgi:hypothetical protein